MSRITEIHVPGQTLPGTPIDPMERIAELERRLDSEREQHAETQRKLMAITQGRPVNLVDLPVIEPETEHGRAAKANSRHLHMTSAECHKAGVGRVVLAADGYYVPPKLPGQ